MAELKLTMLQRALLILAIFLCLNLALAAYNQAYEFVKNESEFSIDLAKPNPIKIKTLFANSIFSPFSNARLNSLSDLAGQQQELSKRLEFMVWPTERAALLRELDKLYQERINLDPLRAQFWIELLNSNAWQRTGKQQRFWILDKTAIQLKWNLANKYILAKPCAQDFESLSELSKTLCPELLSKLPYEKRFKQTARKMAVSHDRLNEVLKKAQLINDLPNE